MISSTIEWIRLPKPKERCAITSLSRTGLSELCRAIDESGAPVVKTVRLKKPGAKREVLLINRASLLRFLEAKANEQAAPARFRLAPETSFARFTEYQIAEKRDLWTWAVNPPFFPEAHEWFVGRLSSVDTRLNMMRQAGLCWTAVESRASGEKVPSTTRLRKSKRYDRVLRDWSKLTEIQRLNYWAPLCKEISKRAVGGWDLGQLNPPVFVTFLQFVCLENYDRGADTPFPTVLKNPRKALKFASAIRSELDNLACNPEQREALRQRLVKAEQFARIKNVEGIPFPLAL